MTPAELTRRLKDQARAVGFDLAGVCPAVTPPGIERLREWLAAGCAGEMQYMAGRRAAYEHPAHVLQGARSILMLGAGYRTEEPAAPGAGQGRVSRYAWGRDYHDVMRERLRRLARWLQRAAPGARVRGVVDSAPLMEREFARLAGLGWIGRNTLLLDRALGSWLFLAALLTDRELEYDAPFEGDYCGTCRACLDACPTGALVDSYRLDARRCISYLTIELRGEIPAELRPGVGDWLFGCDACQEVCPWNRRAPRSAESGFRPAEGMDPADAAALLGLDDAAFRARFRRTPLWRAKRGGLLRNAAIVLGNRPTPEGHAALKRGLHDPEPTVRAACAWALGQYRDEPAQPRRPNS